MSSLRRARGRLPRALGPGMEPGPWARRSAPPAQPRTGVRTWARRSPSQMVRKRRPCSLRDLEAGTSRHFPPPPGRGPGPRPNRRHPLPGGASSRCSRCSRYCYRCSRHASSSPAGPAGLLLRQRPGNGTRISRQRRRGGGRRRGRERTRGRSRGGPGRLGRSRAPGAGPGGALRHGAPAKREGPASPGQRGRVKAWLDAGRGGTEKGGAGDGCGVPLRALPPARGEGGRG